MKLFDRDGRGAEELAAAIGFMRDVDYELWKGVLPLGIRDVAAIVGNDVTTALATFYESGCEPSSFFPASCTIPLQYLQRAVACFTWLKIIPTLDAQHDTNGRARRLGENEKGMTALEQYKDEANVQRLAYEFTDALIEALDTGQYKFWIEGSKYRMRSGLLLRSKEEFDEYYVIGSHRLFITLLPLIREAQETSIVTTVGRDMLKEMLASNEPYASELNDCARRAVALLAIKKAVERLPIEVLPEGIVQVNQQVPVQQRLRAEKSARDSVAASLGADADRYLRQLEDAVSALRSSEEKPVEHYTPGPILHTKGMTF